MCVIKEKKVTNQIDRKGQLCNLFTRLTKILGIFVKIEEK